MQQHGIQQGYVQPQGVLWKSLGKHLTCRKALLAGASCCTLGANAQGFNERYDAFGQGFAQGSYGLERSGSGYTVFSVSFEPDTITPDSLLATYSIILQHIDDEGVLGWQRRYHRPIHREFLGWADCCDTVPGGGMLLVEVARTSIMWTRPAWSGSTRKVIRSGRARTVVSMSTGSANRLSTWPMAALWSVAARMQPATKMAL